MGGKYLKQHDFSSSEPLYQTYRATVITREIRRQTVCRNISKTSMDFTMDWADRQTGTGTGNGAPRGNPVATPGQSTLWQDLANVRKSGVLEQLTPEERKYQEVRFRRPVATGRGIKVGCERLHQGFNRILKSSPDIYS